MLGPAPRQQVGVVHDDVDPARAAAAQEPVQLRDARRGTQAQRRQVGIEDAQLARGLLEQAVDRLLEFGFAFETPVLGLRLFFTHGVGSSDR